MLSTGIKANASYPKLPFVDADGPGNFGKKKAVEVARKEKIGASLMVVPGKAIDQVRIMKAYHDSGSNDEGSLRRFRMGYGQKRGDYLCQKIWDTRAGVRLISRTVSMTTCGA